MLKTYIACTDELENSMLFFSLYAGMPQYRKEKIDRMVFPKDKRLSLGAGTLLDYALTLEGVSDREITYVQNQKPCLKNSNIRFNLSHSGNMVFCAVSDKDVGCDVEQITDIDMQIAARFFFHEEYEAISACPDSTSINDLFFRYWTLKESFMKVTGLGFKLNLDDFCIDLRSDGIDVKQSVDSRNYYFKEYTADTGYKFSVCTADAPPDDSEPNRVSFAKIAAALRTHE